MTIRIRPLARRDLKRHFRYIHQFNSDAAWGFRTAVLATIKQIGRHPGIGHQMDFRRWAGIRSIVIKEYSIDAEQGSAAISFKLRLAWR